MKQILIGKQIAYAAKVGGGTIAGLNELNLLDTGAIACFAENGTILTQAGVAAEMADQKKFYIAVGNQVDIGSKSRISSLIPRVGTNYVKTAYAAPVKQKKFVGYDGTTVGTALNYPTLVIGDEAQIKITDTTKGLRTVGDEVKRYNTVVKASDTGATITARLIAAINDDIDRIVNATTVAVNTGIAIEAKENGTTFDIALSGIIENATMVEKGGAVEGVAVAPNFGEGTYDLVLAMEDEFSVTRGNTNKLMQPALWYKNTSLATQGLTYNMYTFAFSTKGASSLEVIEGYNAEVKVAIPSTGTAPTTAFEAIMAEIFGGVFSTSDQETGV